MIKTNLTLLTALLLAPLAALNAQEAARWVLPEVSVPRVQRLLFESKAAGRQTSCHVFTPQVYEAGKGQRFPVLYWLHGTGGGLPGIPQLSAFFDRAMQEGHIPPMLVVFPNALPGSMWCDSKDGSTPIETVLIKEPIRTSTPPTAPSPHARGASSRGLAWAATERRDWASSIRSFSERCPFSLADRWAWTLPGRGPAPILPNASAF